MIKAGTPADQQPPDAANTCGLLEFIRSRLIWMDGVPYLRLAAEALPTGTDGPLPSVPVELDPVSRVVRVDGHEARLTGIEFRVFGRLLQGNGRVVSQRELLMDIWEYPGGDASNSVLVRAHVRNIRRKLLQAGVTVEVIIAVRGEGYRLARPFISNEGEN